VPIAIRTHYTSHLHVLLYDGGLAAYVEAAREHDLLRIVGKVRVVGFFKWFARINGGDAVMV
jgi:hypothetical protein